MGTGCTETKAPDVARATIVAQKTTHPPKRMGPFCHSPGDVTFMVRRNATPDTFTFSPGSHRCYHDAAHAGAVVPLDLRNPSCADVPLDEEVHVALVAETLDAHLLRAPRA